jgi:hypothetical protein
MATNKPDENVLAEWHRGLPEGRGIWAGGKAVAAGDRVFLGLMDSEVLAMEAVEAHNKVLSGMYDPGEPG